MIFELAQRLYDQLLPEDFDYDPENDRFLREATEYEIENARAEMEDKRW